MKLFEEKLEPVRLLESFFEQVFLADIEKGMLCEFSFSGQAISAPEEYSVWLCRLAEPLYQADRTVLYEQMRIPVIREFLDSHSEAYTVFYQKEDREEYQIHITYCDESHGKLLFLLHRQNRDTSFLELKQKHRQTKEKLQFLVDHLIESFLETNVRTGECYLLHADNGMQPCGKFSEQVAWWAEHLIVPEEREEYEEEYQLPHLLQTLRERGGHHAATYSAIVEGSRRCLSVVSELYREPAGKQEEYILSYAQDITSQVEQITRNKTLLNLSRQLLNLSQTEPLTGLYNRAAGEKYVDEFLEKEGAAGAMLLLDIDNFKKFNDTYGHPTGDFILSLLGEAIRETFRFEDILCRWGGDEFLIFLSDLCEEEQIIRYVEKLRSEMLQCRTRELSLPVTLSIGITVTHGGRPRQALFEQCDKALYAVKKQGRDNYRFSMPQQ